MSPMTIMDRIKRLPPLQEVRRVRARHHFESESGYATTWGVFASFADAAAAVHASHGFNQAMRASEYGDRVDRVFPYDYPVMFWLERILQTRKAPRIFDIGGHVGVHYFAYGKYLHFPPELTWCISEVERIVAAGRDRAAREHAERLEFTDRIDSLDARTCDVVLSAGALQYVEGPLLWDILARSHAKPRHILLNKLPLYRGEDFVTLQNIGAGFAPHYVWNREEFLRRFQGIGYRVVDEWAVPERNFHLFDDETRSFPSYSGLYLQGTC